jgi:TonB family protein
MAGASGKVERVLRVGIIHQGHIVEERLLRKPGDVTVGLSAKCTFILPISKPPELYRLFVWQDGRYLLRFTAGMAGRIQAGGQVLELSEVREKGLAKTDGAYFLLPLGPDDAGKVIFGEVRVLFQMVAPPPKPKKIVIPPAARGGPLAALDGPYAWAVLASLLLHLGLTAGSQWWWISSGQMEEQTRRESFVYRVLKAELTMKEKAEAQPAEGQGEGEGANKDADAGKGKDDDKPSKRFTKTAGSEGSEEDRYRRQVAKVREGTLLKFLDGEGGGGVRGLVGAEAAGEGMAGAFNTSGGGTLVAGDSFGYRGGRGGGGGGGGGGNTYQKLSDDDVGGGGPIRTGPVATGQRQEEAAVKLRIGGGFGEQAGPGKISVASVESVFRRRRGAIQTCYERALKVNANIEGKVSIRFTIGAAGTVTQIQVVENSTGDSGVGACISEKIKGWPFPPPEGGLVIVTRHFLLMKSG